MSSPLSTEQRAALDVFAAIYFDYAEQRLHAHALGTMNQLAEEMAAAHLEGAVEILAAVQYARQAQQQKYRTSALTVWEIAKDIKSVGLGRSTMLSIVHSIREIVGIGEKNHE